MEITITLNEKKYIAYKHIGGIPNRLKQNEALQGIAENCDFTVHYCLDKDKFGIAIVDKQGKFTEIPKDIYNWVGTLIYKEPQCTQEQMDDEFANT